MLAVYFYVFESLLHFYNRMIRFEGNFEKSEYCEFII